jgi:hypothetical protein
MADTAEQRSLNISDAEFEENLFRPMVLADKALSLCKECLKIVILFYMKTDTKLFIN